MCSSQADNRKMVGENDESMTEKKREKRVEIKQALEVMEQCKKELVKRGEGG